MAYQTVNPYDNQIVATFDDFTDEQVMELLGQAQKTFEFWSQTSFAERTAVIKGSAAILRERSDEFARLLTLEMGKLYTEALGEVELSAQILDYYAEKSEGFLAPEPLETGSDDTAMLVSAPLGVILGVQPWNFPYYQLARVAGPNLMAGNVVMVKHASNVPQAAALPLYKLATVGGGAVVAPTVNDAGSTLNTSGNFNKIGARRFYRFSNASQRNVTITLATSNPDANQDPDFLLWRAGTFVGASTSAPPGPETRTFNNLPAGEYLIEAYDCANGCAPPEGVSGDYDLTVTITAP